MKNRIPENIKYSDINVEFLKADAGWLDYRISAKEQLFESCFSHFYCPLMDLRKWLEDITRGVQQGSFEVDREGIIYCFEFQHFSKGKIIFIISDTEDYEVCFTSLTNRKQFVESFYLTLVHFFSSESYDPEEWEVEFIWERLVARLDVSRNDLNDILADLDQNEFSELLFLVNPEYSINYPGASDGVESIKLFFDTQIIGEELPWNQVEIRTPYKWPVPKEFNYWNRSKKAEYIKECILEPASIYYGTGLKDFKSEIIEDYLKNS